MFKVKFNHVFEINQIYFLLNALHLHFILSTIISLFQKQFLMLFRDYICKMDTISSIDQFSGINNHINRPKQDEQFKATKIVSFVIVNAKFILIFFHNFFQVE